MLFNFTSFIIRHWNIIEFNIHKEKYLYIYIYIYVHSYIYRYANCSNFCVDFNYCNNFECNSCKFHIFLHSFAMNVFTIYINVFDRYNAFERLFMIDKRKLRQTKGIDQFSIVGPIVFSYKCKKKFLNSYSSISPNLYALKWIEKMWVWYIIVSLSNHLTIYLIFPKS